MAPGKMRSLQISTSIVEEFEGAQLGDRRLERRLTKIASRIAEAPEESFPKLTASEAEREALYRFFSNDSVEPKAILGPHVAATIERCSQQPIVRIAHDTTVFSYDGERKGLGKLPAKKQGFFVHMALAVSGSEERAPFGAVGFTSFIREEKEKLSRNEQKRRARAKSREDKESKKWGDLVSEVANELQGRVECVHIMDREADDYALFADLVSAGHRFVVRGWAGRNLSKSGLGKVQDELDAQPARIFRSVPLTVRRKSSISYDARGERTAELHLRSTSVILHRPRDAQTTVGDVQLNVVQVFEPNPPVGAEPVSWTLFTTEPISCHAEVVAVVDHYRARWRIEELFKAIKTGCAAEKRQLTTLDALLRAVAVFIPVAWRLLALRVLARNPKPPPASALFEDHQIEVLRSLARDYEMPRRPNVRDIMFAIASIGGHVRSNGEPGWIVLARGFTDFLKAERVWTTALACAAKKK